ncbi:hypothetical protein [Mesorhizobium sp. M0674]|uniref:hypothetical protein n=1 Tax=unclassified Mesorhizobium TaxID=325217 RepID=UPI00333A48DE
MLHLSLQTGEFVAVSSSETHQTGVQSRLVGFGLWFRAIRITEMVGAFDTVLAAPIASGVLQARNARLSRRKNTLKAALEIRLTSLSNPILRRLHADRDEKHEPERQQSCPKPITESGSQMLIVENTPW